MRNALEQVTEMRQSANVNVNRSVVGEMQSGTWRRRSKGTQYPRADSSTTGNSSKCRALSRKSRMRDLHTIVSTFCLVDGAAIIAKMGQEGSYIHLAIRRYRDQLSFKRFHFE